MTEKAQYLHTPFSSSFFSGGGKPFLPPNSGAQVFRRARTAEPRGVLSRLAQLDRWPHGGADPTPRGEGRACVETIPRLTGRAGLEQGRCGGAFPRRRCRRRHLEGALHRGRRPADDHGRRARGYRGKRDESYGHAHALPGGPCVSLGGGLDEVRPEQRDAPALTWAPAFGGRKRFPPPEKNELVLSIETGCADTVPFQPKPNNPF